MNKTILIGPTGFLGLSFLQDNPNIIAVGRSKLPSGYTNRFVQITSDDDFTPLDTLEFDNVIFLIGSSEHKVLNSHPTMAIEKNVLSLTKFLWYLQQSGKSVNKIVSFTTMLQYDSDKMTLPCAETEPKNPFVNNYVFSKYLAELVTERYRDQFSIIDIRLSNVYGPTPLRRPDLIPTLVWKLLDGEEMSVWTKRPKRDFVYVQDVIDAVLKLLDSNYSGPLNIGSGEMHSVGDVCDILSRLSGKEIASLDKEVSGHMEYCHDLSLVKSLIDWSPSYGLEQGLTETYGQMQEFSKAVIGK